MKGERKKEKGKKEKGKRKKEKGNFTPADPRPPKKRAPEGAPKCSPESYGGGLAREGLRGNGYMR
jgi:hypothetical protein